MKIQEIAITGNQKKKIQKAIKGEAVIFEDENGDLIINVDGYLDLKDEKGKEPLEEILGEETLDYEVDFFVLN
jgi:hypothetical protein